jgi:hypothetical protein
MYSFPVRFSFLSVLHKVQHSGLFGLVVALLVASFVAPASADVRDSMTFPDYKKVEKVKIPQHACSLAAKQNLISRAEVAVEDATHNVKEVVAYERRIDALPNSSEKSQLSREVSSQTRRKWRDSKAAEATLARAQALRVVKCNDRKPPPPPKEPTKDPKKPKTLLGPQTGADIIPGRLRPKSALPPATPVPKGLDVPRSVCDQAAKDMLIARMDARLQTLKKMSKETHDQVDNYSKKPNAKSTDREYLFLQLRAADRRELVDDAYRDLQRAKAVQIIKCRGKVEPRNREKIQKGGRQPFDTSRLMLGPDKGPAFEPGGFIPETVCTKAIKRDFQTEAQIYLREARKRVTEADRQEAEAEKMPRSDERSKLLDKLGKQTNRAWQAVKAARADLALANKIRVIDCKKKKELPPPTEPKKEIIIGPGGDTGEGAGEGTGGDTGGSGDGSGSSGGSTGEPQKMIREPVPPLTTTPNPQPKTLYLVGPQEDFIITEPIEQEPKEVEPVEIIPVEKLPCASGGGMYQIDPPRLVIHPTTGEASYIPYDDPEAQDAQASSTGVDDDCN